MHFLLTIPRDEMMITVTNLQFFQLRSCRAFTETISKQGRYPMPRDAQQAEIAKDLQCFARKFFQIAIYHVELLKSSVHAEEAMLFDQSQRRVDELQHPHIQRIQSGPVKSHCGSVINRIMYLMDLFRHLPQEYYLHISLFFYDIILNQLTYITFIQNQFLDRHALISQIREGKAETGQIRILTAHV